MPPSDPAPADDPPPVNELIKYLNQNSDHRAVEDRSAEGAAKWLKIGKLTKGMLGTAEALAKPPTPPPPTIHLIEDEEEIITIPWVRRKGRAPPPPPSKATDHLASESRALLALLMSDAPPTASGFGVKVTGSQLLSVFPHSDAKKLQKEVTSAPGDFEPVPPGNDPPRL